MNRTLEEADACRRDGITITTFMIATDTYLVEFVDKLTKINRGRAYYASPYNLAEFLFDGLHPESQEVPALAPDDRNNRGQMGVFLVKTFGLPLYRFPAAPI